MESQIVYSSKFHAGDAEVVYESSDHVRFRIHSVYLKAHTEALPSSNLVVDEVAQLSEPASILEILFSFIYPMRQPDLLVDFEFRFLKDVAEAAEKYQVFPAMYLCFLQMRESLNDHVADVLGYALKHDYDALANQAARLALDLSTSVVLSAIPSDYHAKWLAYSDGWRELQKRALTVYAQSNPSLEVVKRLAGSLHILQETEKAFEGDHSGWKSLVDQDIAQHPELAVFISSRTPTTTHNASTHTGDLILECSNEVQLHIDRAVLVACSPGFLELLDQGNTVHLPESSSVMLRLLSFIRPVRCTDLSLLDFSELMELAEAAEKYKLYSAMGLCKLFVSKILPSNAKDVFFYAGRYGYYDILDLAAPLVLDLTNQDVASQLPNVLLQPWIDYYQQWQSIAYTVASHLGEEGLKVSRSLSNSTTSCSNSSRSCSCRYCGSTYRQLGSPALGMCDNCENPFAVHSHPIIMKLFKNPQGLTNLDELFSQPPDCSSSSITRIFRSCRDMAQEAVTKVRALSTFIPDTVES